MARKRLSDLLREEEQKGEEKSTALAAENANASPTPTNPNPVEPDSAEAVVAVTGEVIAPDDLSQAHVELRNAAAEPEPTPATDASAIRATVQTDLENTVEQLKTEVKTLQQLVQEAQTKEAALQTRIDQLQTETAAQHKQIQRLQSEAAQSEQVKTELEAAKQLILKLSQPQPSASPTPQAARPSAKSTPTVLPNVRAAEPELDSKPVEMIVPAKPAAADRPKLHQMALRKMLDHPTQPGSLPPMPSEKKSAEKEVKLSDTDVGWMD